MVCTGGTVGGRSRSPTGGRTSSSEVSLLTWVSITPGHTPSQDFSVEILRRGSSCVQDSHNGVDRIVHPVWDERVWSQTGPGVRCVGDTDVTSGRGLSRS